MKAMLKFTTITQGSPPFLCSRNVPSGGDFFSWSQHFQVHSRKRLRLFLQPFIKNLDIVKLCIVHPTSSKPTIIQYSFIETLSTGYLYIESFINIVLELTMLSLYKLIKVFTANLIFILYLYYHLRGLIILRLEFFSIWNQTLGFG